MRVGCFSNLDDTPIAKAVISACFGTNSRAQQILASSRSSSSVFLASGAEGQLTVKLQFNAHGNAAWASALLCLTLTIPFQKLTGRGVVFIAL